MKRVFVLVLLLFFTFSGVCDSKSIDKRAVYDLTTGDVLTVENRLISSIISNNNYYQSRLEEYKVIVVIHGEAYKFFMNDLKGTAYMNDKKLIKKHDEIKKRLLSLSKLYDVKFEVCGVGIKNRHLNPKSFYSFVKIAHNAISSLVDAQNSGYAYIPIN